MREVWWEIIYSTVLSWKSTLSSQLITPLRHSVIWCANLARASSPAPGHRALIGNPGRGQRRLDQGRCHSQDDEKTDRMAGDILAGIGLHAFIIWVHRLTSSCPLNDHISSFLLLYFCFINVHSTAPDQGVLLLVSAPHKASNC